MVGQVVPASAPSGLYAAVGVSSTDGDAPCTDDVVDLHTQGDKGGGRCSVCAGGGC